MKKQILFIINPNSGNKRGAEIVKWLPQYLDKDKFDYSHKLTERAQHATEIAQDAVKEGIDIVAAVGGDGLVNEVFQSLVNTDTAFTIIPKGSGNGVARSLGIPMNIKKALNNLNEAKYSKMDTATFNDQPYLGVAGIGFDGLIAWEFAKTKKRGVLSYVKLILQQLSAYESSTYRITFNNEVKEFDAFIITIANTQQYGNDAYIAPQAELDNGLLDLVVIKKHSKWLLPLLAIRIMNKSIHKYKYVEILKASRFTVESIFEQSHIDGEPILAQNQNVVSVLPHSLKIYS